MANATKISQLTTAGPLTGAELVPIVQSGGTLQTTVSLLGIFATSTVSSDIAVVSTRLDQVSARVSANAAAITSLGNVVSALEVRVSAVSALAAATSAALTSTNNVVSALEVRVSAASATGAANSAAITSVNNVVSALEIRVSAVSAAAVANAAAITSINNVVSALEIRVSAASATGASNAAAITSINNVVSALEIRVSSVSAATSVNAAAISVLDIRVANVSASVSSLNIQVAAVQASISAINSVLAAIDVSAVLAVEARVSALEIRVSAVSVLVSANTAAIVSTNAVIANVSALVSTLNIRVAAVSASVSALQVQVNAVSAALTSTNAVVSLKANRNGDFLTNVQYIDFNTTTSYAPTPGRLTWDIGAGTLDLGLTGTVNLLIGQRTVAQVYNNSGVTLPKGKAVRVTGAQGQRLTGALAQADSDADSLTIFGIMLETVSVNNSGYVATDGLVRNVNTIGYSDGDIVYLSPVSAGELTPTKPVAPQHLVQMGYIVNGGSGGAGEIYVKVQNGYELGELHDVKTSTSTSLADGEVLAYNVSAKVWTNSPALTLAQASISALDIRVAAVSASVSALQVQVNNVSALVSAAFVSIGQRVLKAGDTMTGQLAIAVAANTIGVSVSGGLVVTSVVNFTGNSALLLHAGSTATRPSSPVPGQIRFNSDSNTFEGYTSATWGAIGGGGGATGGGTNQVFYLNDQVVSVSYSIPAGKNAGSFGPITIASGVTVEVPTSSVWTVV